ncbi:MAG: hypothetical protein RIM84_02240 [Alphaproteobacteria bacterium]
MPAAATRLRLDARLTPHDREKLADFAWEIVHLALSGGVGEALTLAEDWRKRAPDARLDIDDLYLATEHGTLCASGWLRLIDDDMLPIEGELVLCLGETRHLVRLEAVDGRATVNGCDLVSWLAVLVGDQAHGEGNEAAG